MSQITGSFSGTDGKFQITSNGVIFEDNESEIKPIGSLSENSNEVIPEYLKDECVRLYEETGIIHIILDISDKAKIASKLGLKYLSREIKIDSIIDSKFEVVPWFELLDFPSRDTFYDSITKNANSFERHKFILDFMNSLEFKISNLLDDDRDQQEILWDCYQREYSYTTEFSNRIILRVKPNLMIEVVISPDKNDSVEINKRYFIFFDPDRILKMVAENSDIIQKRNLKIKSLLT